MEDDNFDDPPNDWVKVYEYKFDQWLYSALTIALCVALSMAHHHFFGGSVVIDIFLCLLCFFRIVSVLSWYISRDTFVGSRDGAIVWLHSRNVRSKYSDQKNQT